MADIELSKALRDLPNRVQTATCDERITLFQNVTSVLDNPGINASIVKGICKVIGTTLTKYKDTPSQILVRNLIVDIVKQHHDVAIECLSSVVKTVLNKEISVLTPQKSAKYSVIALGWTDLIIRNGDFHSNIFKTEYSKLVEYQSQLYHHIVLSYNIRIIEMAEKLLFDLWTNIENYKLCSSTILQKESASHIVVFLMLLLRFENSKEDIEYDQRMHRAELLEHFIKVVITSKIMPQNSIVKACEPLLKIVTQQEFEGVIYPVLLKSILRSPEMAIRVMGLIFHQLNIDLSEYASSLGKVLLQHLYCKDDIVRGESLEALKELSLKCTTVKSVEYLLKGIFGSLNGDNGKITVAEYRINLIQGAGYLSFNAISYKETPIVLLLAIELFSKALVTEIQERVISCTLDMFSLWMLKLSGELPKSITDVFKRGLDLKTTTQTVRISYLQWFLAGLNNANLRHDLNITSILIKIVEKGLQSPLQISLVCESVCAACIIIQTNTISSDPILGSFWSTMFDMNKQIFFSERFMLAAPPETLCYVSLMAEILLTQYSDKLKGPLNVLFKAIVCNLISNSQKLRTYTLNLLPKLKNTNNGVDYIHKIMMELENQIDNIKFNTDCDYQEENVAAKNILGELMQSICNFDQIPDDAKKLSLQSLLICHHPGVFCNNSVLWETILKNKFNFDPEIFVSLNAKEITNIIVDNFQPKKTYENSISTIVRLSPGKFLPILVQNIITDLIYVGSSDISEEEYYIFVSPKGETFDEKAIKNDIYATTGHTRDNKHQIEKIIISESDKKRYKGKASLSEPSQKQEAIKNQIEKGNYTRDRLGLLNKKLKNAISMLEAAFAGNPKAVSLHFHELLMQLLQLLACPIAAESVAKLYFKLREACFEDCFDLGKDIAIITLRLENPRLELPNEWITNDVNEVIKSILLNIHKLIIYRQTDGNENASTTLFNAPSFTYIFEFLKRAFVTNFVANSEELLFIGIQIIESHAQIRGFTVIGEVTDYNHPKYMPCLEMSKLLLNIINTYQGRVETQAAGAILEVANLSSGEDYCTYATDDEIALFLNSLESGKESVREVSLRALKIIKKVILFETEAHRNIISRLKLRLWIAKFDISVENRILASDLWESVKFSPPDLDDVLLVVTHKELCIQKAASASLLELLSTNHQEIKYTIKSLLEIYREKLTMIPPKLDQFDREIFPAIDQWEPRRGIAISISQISKFFDVDDVNEIMQFMVSQGFRDRNETVHKEMLASALCIVDHHGKETIVNLLPVFEDFLDKAPKSQTYDNVRQAVVILMGSLARHLDADDTRIEPIVRRLISALSTPSQQVQEAVANCLPHLVSSVKDRAPEILKKLLQQLIKSDKYGERRGAAYGIAGIVKGLGILSLKQFDIMSKLTTYIQEKKNYKSREGALFAFEVLCTTLGRLFEPYIVHVLPHLLQCFGDSSQYVRQAADDTAKVVMGKLSAHGVKLVLPSLLNALDEDSWRTKTASVELLGAMAFCAPKQLSSCLPNIVPKLIEVLGDSHTKVQEAGADALKVIGSVIKNPEIQAIVPILLTALEDPSKNTSNCLHSLLQTKFVHFIDAPSLALIMPVVERAFMDRSTETRKMAAQIIGNMYSLTDQKDLVPYLPNIIPGLKMSLLDPVPEVRAISARALGAMVRGIGESSFEDLLPWLMQTLTSESSSVDRSGAAQGLAEVVGGLGVEKLHQLMPDIITTAERTDIAPHVKDGYIMMFIYMPGPFPKDFTPYIGQIINPILKALADENEYVRETALKAGQRIVNLYAESAVMLLLPELEKGLFDDNWRIRFSSVQLLGDLLYRISGVSGKMTTETASEDDNFGTEQSHTAIIRFLGEERRNRVLSGLYMGRSDVSLMVRQASLHVWKVVVTNTPRTLREILPTLFSLLLGCLASTSYDKRQVAARTLGDLVRKLGERVLPEIIPILEKGLNSEYPDQRQGVCIGLSEIMASTSKEMVLSFVNSLVPTVRKALSDPLPEVRGAAAKTFESLHSTVGSRALDDILPSMLEGLNDPDPNVSEYTLDGLRQVMTIKSRVVLPYLVPQLTAVPVNTKALSILVSVAGDALTKYLPKILDALLQALSDAQGTAYEYQELDYCQAVILSVTDEIGVRTIVDTLMMSAKSDSINIRKSASSLLCVFCTHSPADYSQYVPQLLRCLLRLMADSNREILQNSWDALSSVVKALDSTQQIALVSDVRQAVRFASSEMKGSELPGFCLPKGITPLLPVFREAILNGMPDVKENAAEGLGEVISLTSAQSLQPSVVQITGPLIRILGDRFNAGVKAAVLETLAILLKKVGVMLKQFLPQLQTTFLKALHDSNRSVRMKAGQAISELVIIHSRPDSIFNEIHNGIKCNDDPSMRETMLAAIRLSINLAGEKMSVCLKQQICTTLLNMIGHSEDITRTASAGCLGALLKYLTPQQVDDLLEHHILIAGNGDGLLKHGRTAVLFVSLKESPSMIITPKFESKVIEFITASILSDKINIASSGVRAMTCLLQYYMSNDIIFPLTIVSCFIRAMNHKSNEIKQVVAISCNYLAKMLALDKMSPDVIKQLVPMLVNGTKEKNGYVKSNSEIALVSILHLRDNDTTFSYVCQILEVGARDSLNEVVNKVLRKVAVQSIGKDEEFDDTMLN
ncbi:eIF-2-alpha kinase activator GCN1 [Zeugodacus cucurbitae]|uniref:Translational activator GCN1 n=2 Tax=Zeugodacus cucurbitae TaxID=28588 RepID=A0A0A1XE05_ZEUCU|nr:eIF-2-alpha kinase activator GCN1 [Zeugodacus cucurbitae]XP_054081870.1 eIF-2-alpha kinase activator GCN1 [Zeugodacus cucurbitae]